MRSSRVPHGLLNRKELSHTSPVVERLGWCGSVEDNDTGLMRQDLTHGRLSPELGPNSEILGFRKGRGPPIRSRLRRLGWEDERSRGLEAHDIRSGLP